MNKFAILFLLFATVVNAHFVGSSNSDKYHNPSCHWANKINPQNLVIFSDAEEASAAGYVPCKVCKPSSNTYISQSKEKSSYEAVSSGERCQAITQKGTQCKRNASSGSRFCWQHK